MGWQDASADVLAGNRGVIGLAKSAALEYVAKGIRINAVRLGTVETPMVIEMLAKEPDVMKEIMRDQPIGRLGRPEEIASAVLWLCSPGASFVIGHALAVDGGFTAQTLRQRVPSALANTLFIRWKDARMSAWRKSELRTIVEADDLYISPFREDSEAYGTPTWIWSVAVDDALYVRAYNGQNSRWYQAAVRQKAGRIIAAGMTKEVTFKPVEGAINDLIDDAYRTKYHASPYLSSMIGARARSATVKIMPLDTTA